MERRDTIGRPARAVGKGRISGYAAVFYDPKDPGTQYDAGPFRERIARGAFDAVLGDDVVALFNHNQDVILGRSSAGTLRLQVDKVGLRYTIDADTIVGRPIAEAVARGDVRGSSFAFDFGDVEEDKDGVRTVKSFARLYDVGPVVFPAYEATSANARAAGGVDTWMREAEMKLSIVRLYG